MSKIDKAMVDDLLDSLMDLKHNLGKYIHLPVAMLPADAGPDEVRQALESALLRTRKGPNGVVAARYIWESFADESANSLFGCDTFNGLYRAATKALCCEDKLKNKDVAIDRKELEADLSAVSPAIQAVIDEVRRG